MTFSENIHHGPKSRLLDIANALDSGVTLTFDLDCKATYCYVTLFYYCLYILYILYCGCKSKNVGK